ncbi:hypothetical protein [Nocardia sp. NPDC050412]|uniref:hypothetical protein n=1 Tax=unclassified Nocardia TaxID=2637762 RepID=UPI003792E00F
MTPDVLDQANAVRRLYPSLRLDLADAVIVALAADYETDGVRTLGRRDFRALTLAHAAQNLFAYCPTISYTSAIDNGDTYGALGDI